MVYEYKPGKSSRMYPILLLLNEYGPMTTADLALNLNVTTKQLWRRMTTYEHDYKIISSKYLPKSKNPGVGRRIKLFKINKKGKIFLKHMINIKTLYPDQWGIPNYDKWKNPSFEQWINKNPLAQRRHGKVGQGEQKHPHECGSMTKMMHKTEVK